MTDRAQTAHEPADGARVDRAGAGVDRASAGTTRRGRSRMPWGIALFLGYALLILVGVGLSLPAVIDLAIDTPVSFPGLVVMALLAYTIFTITLVWQRKNAARTLALGLASLTLPPIALALAYGLAPPAVALAAFAALLFRGLTRPAVARWLDEV